MVRISKISKCQLFPYVEIAFSSDKELINYHALQNASEYEMVYDTVNRIFDTSVIYDLKYYKILFENKPIGFFVVGKDFLYSFGINIRYRKAEILKNWFNFVKEILKHNFYCVINEQNTRAIDFLKRQRLLFSKKDEVNKTIILIYNKQ